MKCRYCGAELPENASVCFECGGTQVVENVEPVMDEPSEESVIETPTLGNEKEEKLSKNQMRCRNWKAVLPAGSTVCFECGASQVDTPVEQPAMTTYNTQPVTPIGTRKSKILAAILAFFLGVYGIDKFYLGDVKGGALRIGLSLISCGFIGGIWGVIDCVRILIGSISKDANGIPLE